MQNIDLACCSVLALSQLWECRRLLQCFDALSAAARAATSPSRRLPLSLHDRRCALCIFRLQGPAAQSLQSSVRIPYKKLALLLHPDKVPQELQGIQSVFEEAFKVLQHAQEMVLALK